MILIGITGGVGAGKSLVLSYMEKNYNCRIIMADEVAHDVMEPGTECYKKLKKIFADDNVYLPEGDFNRPALAKVLFSDEAKREQLNAIVHPAVHEEIIKRVEAAREENTLDALILEAALLIEAGYADFVNEVWYIYASEDTRRERLKRDRGYSDEKIDGIYATQLKESEFRTVSKEVIDNNSTIEVLYSSIDSIFTKKKIFKI